MNEKKVAGRNVAIALGIICIVLAVSLAGAIANYTLLMNDFLQGNMTCIFQNAQGQE